MTPPRPPLLALLAGALLAGALLLAPAAWGAERRLADAEIAALLPTIVAVSATTRQTFSAAGATTYADRGRDSYGRWAARGDQYCSQWPPADGWACYDIFVDDDAKTLIWVGESGRRTETRMEPK